MDDRTSECKGQKVDVPIAKRTSAVIDQEWKCTETRKTFVYKENTKLEQDGWGQRNLQGTLQV